MSECENLFSHIYYTKKFFKCWKEQNKFSSYVMKCEGLLTKFKVILKTLSSSYDCSVIDQEGTLDPLEFRFYETLEDMCPNLQGLQGRDKRICSNLVSLACFYSTKGEKVPLLCNCLHLWEHTSSIITLLEKFGVNVEKINDNYWVSRNLNYPSSYFLLLYGELQK